MKNTTPADSIGKVTDVSHTSGHSAAPATIPPKDLKAFGKVPAPPRNEAFSFYSNKKTVTPARSIDVAELYRLTTRSDAGRLQVAVVRAAPDEETREGAKGLLPGVTVAGTFSTRSNAGLIESSGLIVLDFDDVAAPERLRDVLARCIGCVLAFVSPSGTGVKAVFRHTGAPEHHAHTFRQIAAYVAVMFGLPADKSGKDISRLCYLSHDPDARFNPDAAPFEVTPPADSGRTLPTADAPTQPGATDENVDVARARVWIQNYFLRYEGGFIAGNRDAAITSVIGKLNVRGVPLNVTETALRAELEQHPEGAKLESRKARDARAGAAWVDGKLEKVRRMYRDYADEHGTKPVTKWTNTTTPILARYPLSVDRFLDEAAPELDAVLDAGRNSRALLIAPTGSGKTTYIINRALRKPGEITILAVPNTTTAAQLTAKYRGVWGAYEGSGWRKAWKEHGGAEIQAGGAIVFVSTYDQVADVKAAIHAAGGRLTTVVVDEFHEATNAADYRAKAVDAAFKAGGEAPFLILMTATPPQYTADFLGQGWTTVRVEQRRKKRIYVPYETHWNLDRVACDMLAAVEAGEPVVFGRVNCKRTIKTLICKLTSESWAKAHGFARALRPHQIAAVTGDTRRVSVTVKTIIETGKTPDYVRVVLATQLVDSGLSVLDEIAAVFWVDTNPHQPPTPQALVQFANRFRNMAHVTVRAFFHAFNGTFADGAPRPRGTDDPEPVNFYKREAGRSYYLNEAAEAAGLNEAADLIDGAADLRNGITAEAFRRFDDDGDTRPIEALRVANERYARTLTVAGFCVACTALDERISFEHTDTDWTPDTDADGMPLPDFEETAVKALQKHGRAALYELARNHTHAQDLAGYARHTLRRRGAWCGWYAMQRKTEGLDERIAELVTQLRALLNALPEVINADATAAVEALTPAELFGLCGLKTVLDRLGYLRRELGVGHEDAARVAAENAGPAKWGQLLAALTLTVAAEFGPLGVSRRVGRRLDANMNLEACTILTPFQGRGDVPLTEILKAFETAGLYGWTEKRLGSLIRARYPDAVSRRIHRPEGGQTTVWTFDKAATPDDVAESYFPDAAEQVAAHLRRRAACAAFGNTGLSNSQTLHKPPPEPEPNPEPLPEWCVWVDERRARGALPPPDPLE